MSSSDNLQDILLQAMEIVATSAVKEGSEGTDKTLWNCKIIDDSNKKNGQYRVTNDGVNFDAYSSITTYNKDDHVAVVIPNGDFKNIKYIQQKVAADGTKLPYASPLDNYIQTTNNLMEDIFTETVLYQSDEGRKAVGEISLNGEYTAKNSSNKIIYNNLGLECEFQVNLKNELIKKKGSYGIEVILTYQNEANIEQTEKLEFKSSEFYGDPYSFIIPSKQQKAFALINREKLKKIQVFLVKDFEVKEGLLNEEIPLVKLTGLKIGFGSDIAKIPDDTLEIYTLDNFEYFDDEEGQTKKIGIAWFNKDEDNNYLGFSDGIYDEGYDEEEYLQEKAETKALDDEFNKVGAPTTVKGIELAADVTSIETSITSILSQVDKIMSAAASMRDSIRGAISKITFEENDQTITALNFLQRICDKSSSKEETEGYLIKYHKDIEEQCQQFTKYYRKELGFPIEEEVSEIAPDTLLEKINTLDGYLTIDSDIDSVGFYTIGKNIADTISSEYGGYASLYTSYNEKIKGYRDAILAEIDKIQEIFEKESGFDSRLNLIGGDSDEDYESSFNEDDYAYRYCIYWYKYSRGHEDAIVGKDWERLDQNNFGIPGIGVPKDGTYYNAVSAENSTFEYQIDASAAEEKVMAILFYNHNQYKAEPLVFKRVTSDGTLVGGNGILKIEHGEKSQNNYQNYGEDNYLISASDSRYERTLSLSFSSSIGQTFDDFIGGQIYWYLPKNSTMLTSGTNEGYAVGVDSTSIPTQYYKEGYFCFNKTIAANSTISSVDVKTLQFKYKIKDYYSNSFSNNTVYCKIIKGNWSYEAEMAFSFSSYGTSGTEYTLMISPALGSEAAVTADKPMELSVKLLNYKNEEIPLYQIAPNNATGLYGTNVQVSWVESKNSIKHPIPQVITDELGQITGYTLTADGSISCGIMRIQTTVKFKQDGTSKDTVKIASYYCVPYNVPFDNSNVDFIEGATKITYSTSGNNPKFYKDPYKFFNGRTGEEVESKWSIYDAAGNQDNYPTFNESNQLTPKNSYIPTEGFLLVCAKVNGINRWYQPIYIEQDKYEFNLLNKWDGKLQINEDGGYILSNMLVAGTKNDQNQFTGVMLGDMKITEGSIVEHGMFGFQNGQASFGFRTDGTAFLGKAGKGRIIFDGNESVIKSAGYDNGTGISIDLDAPSMVIKQNNIEYLKFDSNGLAMEVPKFKVETDNLIIDSSQSLIQLKSNDAAGNKVDLFKASSGDFYLQTDDFEIPTVDNNQSGKGVKIALTGKEKGIIAYSGFKIDAKNDDCSFLIDSSGGKDDIMLNVNDRTKIKKDGTVEIYDGGFKVSNIKKIEEPYYEQIVDLTEAEFYNYIKSEGYNSDKYYIQEETDNGEYVYNPINQDSNQPFEEDTKYYKKITPPKIDAYFEIPSQNEQGDIRTIKMGRTLISTSLKLKDAVMEFHKDQGGDFCRISQVKGSLFFTNGLQIASRGTNTGSVVYIGGADCRERGSGIFDINYLDMIGIKGIIPTSNENTISLLSYPGQGEIPIVKIGNKMQFNNLKLKTIKEYDATITTGNDGSEIISRTVKNIEDYSLPGFQNEGPRFLYTKEWYNTATEENKNKASSTQYVKIVGGDIILSTDEGEQSLREVLNLKHTTPQEQ